jgi:hypothetical protein
MKFFLLAFRGTGGFRNPKYKDEPTLIKAGHVGIQLEGDSRVYGFHPTLQATMAVGGEDQLVERLKSHTPHQGCLHDDTEIFERANELFQRGERTEVLVLTIDVSETEFQAIQSKLLEWYNNKKEFWYNFPQEGGGFAEGENNCSTFPQLLGIPIPTDTGFIHEHVAVMNQQGAKRWQPKSNPSNES